MVGLIAAAPFLASVAGQAGASLAGGTAATSLLASPIIQMILGQAGGRLLEGLLGGGQTGFESATQQGLAARTQLIGDLQQQARGLPTAATQAQSRMITREQTRLQQSFGASAQRQGLSGTTPARAQQGRLQAAGLEARAIGRGQLQQSAQQQLGQLTGRAPEQQLIAETQRREARKSFLGGISSIISEARQQESEGVLDADTREAIQTLLDFVKGLRGSLVTGT